MEIIKSILLVVVLAFWLWLPLKIATVCEKQMCKDKAYRVFKMKAQIADLKTKIKSLERELNDYEDSDTRNPTTETD